MRRIRFFALTLWLLAVPIAVVLAQSYSESYGQLRKAPTAANGGIQAVWVTGADSVDATAPVNTTINTRGDPTIVVSSEHFTTSTTCAYSVLLWHRVPSTDALTLLGVQTATATAGSYTSTGGAYVAPLIYFDSAGATEYEVRKAAPSSGYVSYRAWSYGAHSDPAGS